MALKGFIKLDQISFVCSFIDSLLSNHWRIYKKIHLVDNEIFINYINDNICPILRDTDPIDNKSLHNIRKRHIFKNIQPNKTKNNRILSSPIKN